MASKTADVSFCTLSKVIPLNRSKAIQHQSPRGASSLLKVSSSVALSDLKATLGGDVRGERGAVRGGKSHSEGVVVRVLVRIHDITGTGCKSRAKAQCSQKKFNAF